MKPVTYTRTRQLRHFTATAEVSSCRGRFWFWYGLISQQTVCASCKDPQADTHTHLRRTPGDCLVPEAGTFNRNDHRTQPRVVLLRRHARHLAPVQSASNTVWAQLHCRMAPPPLCVVGKISDDRLFRIDGGQLGSKKYSLYVCATHTRRGRVCVCAVTGRI
jgi:hypothetical protein